MSRRPPAPTHRPPAPAGGRLPGTPTTPAAATPAPGYPVRVIEPARILPDPHASADMNPAPSRHRARAFTMVELLVVIAVVVILAALLLAVATHVRKKARSLQCFQNLREWAMVFQNCATDRNGRLPTPENWAAISHQAYDPDSDNPGRSPFVDYWSEDLEEALAIQLQRRHCPCLRQSLAPSGNVAPTYMLNWRLSDPPRFLDLRPDQLDRASSKVLFIDGSAGAPLRLQNKADVAKWIAPAADAHGGMVNAIFADLHVEPVRPKSLEDKWVEMITR